ncbi:MULTISPECIES: acyl carrier protein [unclassified Novosphingobium]|uniref:acyl carrier protein n=1 Tax=unclassified Novosphingobium TaxID=2644732 RepID=UPI00135C925B|nr:MULTISPECIES: acyl carrier protein [unclassified Novosphingobium]
MIKTLIRHHLPTPTALDITPGTELADLGADQLTIHGLALDLGNEVGRDISDDEAAKWVTCGDVFRSAGEEV